MTTVRRVVLLRHAEVPEAWRGRWLGGGTDVGADADALRTIAHDVTALARTFPPHRVLCSPMRRAIQTAALVGHPLQRADALRERGLGDWEGRERERTLVEVDPRHLVDAAAWVRLPVPGAEPVSHLMARTHRLWRALRVTAGTTWCVGHGGSLRCLIAHALDIPLHEAFAHDIPRGGWAVLRRGTGGAWEQCDRWDRTRRP